MALSITGGTWQGRRIATPTHSKVRPTTSRVRESFFSRLGSGIKGTRWLDGYAGSGVMGLEALSRGAASVVAIEGHRQQAKTLLHHRQAFDLSDTTYTVLSAKVEAILARPPKGIQAFLPVDMLYLDPPYAMVDAAWWQAIHTAITGAAKAGTPILRPNTGQLWLEIPKSARVDWPQTAIKYAYGDTVLVHMPASEFL